MGSSLPFACQDRAATKAAYRLLCSDRIDEQDLPAETFARPFFITVFRRTSGQSDGTPFFHLLSADAL